MAKDVLDIVEELWPKFKEVFDAHLQSVLAANVNAMFKDDVRAHYVARRYAEFAACSNFAIRICGLCICNALLMLLCNNDAGGFSGLATFPYVMCVLFNDGSGSNIPKPLIFSPDGRARIMLTIFC